MMRRISWLILLASSLLLLTSGTVWSMDIFGDKPPPVMLTMASDTTVVGNLNPGILHAILGRDDPSIAEPGLLERPDATIKSSVIQTHLSNLRQLYAVGDNEGSRTFDVAEQNGWFKESYLADVVWSARPAKIHDDGSIDPSFIWSMAPQPVIKTICEESGFIRDPAMIFI